MTIAEKLQKIAENEQKVFDAGYEKGKAEAGGDDGSYDEGFADGKQAEYDRFWDTLQQNGNLKNYNYLFYQDRFDDTIYNPKHPIILGVTSSSGNLAVFNSSVRITDTKVPIIAEGVYLNQVFAYSKIKTIRELRVNENTTYNNVFNDCSALEELTITGAIGKNDFNLKWSTELSKDSIVSIVNALSPNTSGLTVTLSLTAVDNAFREGDKEGSISSGWNDLLNLRQNWTISLV